MNWRKSINKLKKGIVASIVVFVIAVLLVPIPSLRLDNSKVLYDRNGQLLSASVASDGQWRFPIDGEVPKELQQCVIAFEDEYYYKHIGVNPISLAKAVQANVKAKKVVRGGSTITMQVMRMYRGNQTRTIPQKMIEILGAIKLEVLYSKKKILKIWMSIAPFGGNTVGAQSAAVRYFNRNLDELSWAEYATLAVLPNSPAIVHLNRNEETLKKKRDALLQKLHEHNTIDETTYKLAISEEIPTFDGRIEQDALHCLQFLSKKYPKENSYQTTINAAIQKRTTQVLTNVAQVYQFDGIQNTAAIIIDNQTNELVAYVGNVNNQNNAIQYVDCAQGQRSYGSLLKPFLYAYSIENGYFLPNEQVKDIPTTIGGFIPKNFDRDYRGIVPMSEMVSKSLNIPAVRVLNYDGVESFHQHLKKDLQLKELNNNPHHYGLSIILGGAEATLWDMSRLYKGLARNHYEFENPYNETTILRNQENNSTSSQVYHPKTVWYTLKAMQSVNRPREEQQFQKIGGQDIAWKTGTSFGHRDAWAIGVTEKYTVAVWVGNQTGEGRYDLTGAKKAGPILFKLFRELDTSGSFTENQVKAKKVRVCKDSGRLAGRLCNHTERLDLGKVSHQLRNCNQHTVTGVDTLYVIDPVAQYYQNKFYGRQQSKNGVERIQIVYPEEGSVLQVPKKLDGSLSTIELSANVTYNNAKLFWFLDEEFISTTTNTHQLFQRLHPGKHQLVIVDSLANSHEVHFEVLQRSEE